MNHNPNTQPPKNEVNIWAFIITQRGTPLMLVGKEEGGRKSEVSFLVAIIHVKEKSPENEAFNLFLVIHFHKSTYYYTFFGLITRRSEVRILPPLLPRKPESRPEALLNEGFFVGQGLNDLISKYYCKD